MILRRRTTRRVPSGPMRTRSSSQPPCSARSTSSLVTTLRGNSRENVSLVELPLHPAARGGAAARGCGSCARPSGHVVERRRTISVGQRLAPRAQSAPRSWAAVRAPDDRRGDAGPVAHPGQRDLERRPAQAVGGAGDGLDDAGRSGRRGRRSTKSRSAGDAPRESDGVPVRYLPVSTPAAQRRPGQHAEPERRARRAAPRRSTARLSREYSTWVEASGARPGTARCQVAAWAVCQPE